MTAVNPYAAPKSDQTPDSSDDHIWREGNLLVVRRNKPMPHRCIKCNEPAALPLRSAKLQWHNPWIYLLVLNPVLYVIVALIFRRKATVEFGLCEQHRRRQSRITAACWGGALLWVVLFVAGPVLAWPAEALQLVYFSIFGVIGVALASKPVGAGGIDDQFVRLRGAGPLFIAPLTEFSRRWQAPLEPVTNTPTDLARLYDADEEEPSGPLIRLD